MSKRSDNLLVLVDGSSYLYRAFHAMPALTNSAGEPTGTIYGVVNMLRRLRMDHPTDHIAVIFDAKGKTFRDDLYDKYKATRPPMPDELRSQIEPLHNVIRAMGLPLLSIEGVEADDVIATLATQASTSGMNTLISTGDKDIAQLVSNDVTLINTMTNTVLDPQGVIDKFGVSANQIVDYLALVGDASDNVPGIPKVGPKTAAKWLQQYGSLDEIIKHADEIKGKVGEHLRNNLGQLGLSRQLVSLKHDVALGVGPAELHVQSPDVGMLQTLYQQLEFKTWLSELLSADSVTNEQSPTVDATLDYETILTKKAFATWQKKLEKADLFAFDTETTSLDYMQAEIVGVSFAVDSDKAAYIPLAHDYPDAPSQLDREEVLQKLKPLLENPARNKLGQNLKYDMNVLANYDIHLDGVRYDSMLESYVLDSTATRHNMDALALKYLGYKTISYEEVAGKGKQQVSFNQVPIEQASPYAAEDAVVSFRLHETLWNKISSQPSLQRVLDEIEIPLIPVLSHIECTGVLVDADMLKRQSDELTKRIGELEKQAHEQAGEEFNLGSPKQIQSILFDKQKLPVIQKTPKGQPSTAESVLTELAEDYPLPALILEHRSLSKLKSTYTDKLPGQINPRTGRVHTSYHQAVAATGRLSSSDPNLQNIPIRSPEGRRIRQAFIAPGGCSIVAADYSQIELRIMAHLSKDKRLLQAFANAEDIHRATAAEVFGVDQNKVTDTQRRHAKAINFGLIYGMSAFGLGKQLNIGRNEAQDYIDRYFNRYPGVKVYMDATRAVAKDKGYVETLFGRRLYVPDIKASNAQRRQYAERTAINAPMQGTAADIIKKAMITTDEWLGKSNKQIKMIMQVHDELVFEVGDKDIDDAVIEIKKRMSAAASLSVPLVVDVGVGSNWDEAH